MKAALAFALVGCAAGGIQPRAVDRVAYPGGRARFEFELHNDLPNGRGRAWYPNGKLASDGTYQDGARHGRFWLYNEDGTFAAQAVYVNNQEVWRSTNDSEQPPEELSKGFVLQLRPAPSEATLVDTGAELAQDAYRAPRPYFSILDRTTAPARAGTQVGVGEGNELGFGAATRFDVFGHYRIGSYGVFAQLSETLLAVPNQMTLAGRRSAILAGTYHHVFGPATLSVSGGLIAAIGNTDVAGSVASYAGAEQRPTDAAVAIAAPFGLRSGASLCASKGQILIQVDTGVDWLFGNDDHGVIALARANVGVGLGTRSRMLTFEFANSLQLSGTQTWFHALALGGTMVFPQVWLTASVALSDSGTTSILGSVGHDL